MIEGGGEGKTGKREVCIAYIAPYYYCRIAAEIRPNMFPKYRSSPYKLSILHHHISPTPSCSQPYTILAISSFFSSSQQSSTVSASGRSSTQNLRSSGTIPEALTSADDATKALECLGTALSTTKDLVLKHQHLKCNNNVNPAGEKIAYLVCTLIDGKLKADASEEGLVILLVPGSFDTTLICLKHSPTRAVQTS